MNIEDETIYTNSNDKLKNVIETLFRYFEEDDRRSEIRLVLPRGESEYIRRQELYYWADLSLKYIGISAGATLEGLNPDLGLSYIKYRCPIEQCSSQPKEVININPPPKCDIHNKTQMVPIS